MGARMSCGLSPFPDNSKIEAPEERSRSDEGNEEIGKFWKRALFDQDAGLLGRIKEILQEPDGLR